MESRHRVIVQLTEKDSEPLSMSRSNSNHQRPIRPHNVRNMPLDLISSDNGTLVRAETMLLVDNMLLKKHNCCVGRFFLQRNVCPLSFLCSLLVSKVDQCLTKSSSCIRSVRIEYYDLHKYDIVNMIQRGEAQVPGGGNFSYRSFTQMMDLLKWLQTSFVNMWYYGKGHDYLDLQYVFYDARRNIHKVKLSVYCFYVANMDFDTKQGIQKFFLHLNGNPPRKCGGTMLINCLREYYSITDTWYTWLFFDVPTEQNGDPQTNELLKLANAAFTGLKDNGHLDPGESFEKLLLESNTDLRETEKYIKTRNILHETMPGKRVTRRDTDNIANWYCKIDEKYFAAIRAMEEYYDNKYELNVTKVCGDIQEIVRTVEHDELKFPPDQVSGNISFSKDPSAQIYYDRYKIAVKQFHTLHNDLQTSNYSSILRVYYKAKNRELIDHTQNYKLKQLENCKARISGAMTSEFSNINLASKPKGKKINPYK